MRFPFFFTAFVCGCALCHISRSSFDISVQRFSQNLFSRKASPASLRKVVRLTAYLVLSPEAVYSYRYRTFKNLGIRSDVELTVLAVRHGLAANSRDLDQLRVG